MEEYLSASARRAVEAAALWANRLTAPQLDPVHLMLAIVEQEESRGAVVLASFGLTLERLVTEWKIDGRIVAQTVDRPNPVQMSQEVRQALTRVRGRSIERGADNPSGTDTLLFELLGLSSQLRERLEVLGTNTDSLISELARHEESDSQPIASEHVELELADFTETVETYRILDAAANRAREGLRVLEDFARFACDDPLLTGELKSLRHQLKEALDRLPRHELLQSRDTEHDVGTRLSTAGEWSRTRPLDVVAANFKRTQEALRSLEEFGKIESRPLAEAIEAARYRLYTLERVALLGSASRERLDGVVLYVLASSDHCPGGLEWTVREALAGGAQVIQLREKKMPDGDLVALARRVRRWTRDGGALFIMNDRPDIARLAEADGVHIGQDEMPVKDARRITSLHALVGVSTHSIEQARQAVLDGTNYIGIGPTFSSQTKSFETLAGLDLIKQVHAEIRLPSFAIGGIDLDRVDEVIAAGAYRVAVSAAVCSSPDPRHAAGEFRRKLLCARSS